MPSPPAAAAAAAAAANSASAAAAASSRSASSSFIPSIVFGHPAGLIHEHPNDAMLFLRARSARSSRTSDASVSLGFRALGAPMPPACVAVVPARYCDVPCRRFWACTCAAEVGFED
ncbi:hypothetical protein BJX68DRAFT_250665, partial [Aspergillus pseudodeflectus]